MGHARPFPRGVALSFHIVPPDGKKTRRRTANGALPSSRKIRMDRRGRMMSPP